jgi:hypothetical protein
MIFFWLVILKLIKVIFFYGFFILELIYFFISLFWFFYILWIIKIFFICLDILKLICSNFKFFLIQINEKLINNNYYFLIFNYSYIIIFKERSSKWKYIINLIKCNHISYPSINNYIIIISPIIFTLNLMIKVWKINLK